VAAFYWVTFSNVGNGFTVNCSHAAYFPNPYLDNPLPDLVPGDHFAFSAFLSPEVHLPRTLVVAYFRILPDILLWFRGKGRTINYYCTFAFERVIWAPGQK
jgi:hypothetical protein